MQTLPEKLKALAPVSTVLSWVETIAAYFRLLVSQFKEDGCKESAAALTYTTLFAIVPIMTVSYSVLAMVPALRSKGDDIQQWLLGIIAPSAGEQVQQYLSEFSRQTTNLTLVGGVFLLVTSVLLLRNIENTLNRIWRVKQPRQGLLAILMYWAVLTLGPIMLGVGLGISSYLTSAAVFTDTVEMFGGMRMWLSLLPLFLTTGMLALLYITVPNCHVPFRQGMLGAFIAAVPLFLLWVYVSWVIVLAGAELVKTSVIFAEYRGNVPKLQALLRALNVLWQRQQEGRVLKPAKLRRTLLDAHVNQWDEYRDLLVELQLVQRTDAGSYVLTRDLRTLSVAELAAMTPWPIDTLFQVGAAPHAPAWEKFLGQRCAEAEAELHNTLGISLEALFSEEIES